jgi:hypothetical protein
MFHLRCEGIEHFLLGILNDKKGQDGLGKKKQYPALPDLEFVLNERDYPHSPLYDRQMAPTFSFSKSRNERDIMYPAWTFWSAGPAISLEPQGLGRWDLKRESVLKVPCVHATHFHTHLLFLLPTRWSPLCYSRPCLITPDHAAVRAEDAVAQEEDSGVLPWLAHISRARSNRSHEPRVPGYCRGACAGVRSCCVTCSLTCHGVLRRRTRRTRHGARQLTPSTHPLLEK